MKQKIKWALLATAVVAIPLFFVHPFGRVKAANSAKPLLSGMHVETPVFNIVQTSCASCHSEQTVWPWYSYVAPVSWLVAHDVHDGREHLNFSKWSEYMPKDRAKKRAGISDLVQQRDDLSIELCALYNQTGQHDKAARLVDFVPTKALDPGESPPAGLVKSQSRSRSCA